MSALSPKLASIREIESYGSGELSGVSIILNPAAKRIWAHAEASCGVNPLAMATKGKKQNGGTAVKMNATAEMQMVDSHRKIDLLVERVAAIRDACGPDFDITISRPPIASPIPTPKSPNIPVFAGR
ncbi:MAG: hypothetical protein P8010_10185 [Desulfosarcinaceae bacterium]|jgi:hypothetical protein